MSVLSPELLRDLVAEARLAPSVHNIQPTRWRLLDDGRLALIDDGAVRVPAADPSGHDLRISHGAALEGMALALGRRGLSIAELAEPAAQAPSRHMPVCMLTIAATGSADRLSDAVARRAAWRGPFAAGPEDEAALRSLAARRDDAIGLTDRDAVAEVAAWADQAELSFLRRDAHRRELLQWMRLSPRHPRYALDGLNRESLAMNAAEALGARIVLGGAFPALDRLGLAASLVSERAKTESAAGLLLFCRAEGEDPLISGRHFYRLWLKITDAGFAACPVSALADHPEFNARLRALGRVGARLRLVNVFRVGRPSIPHRPRHFRLAAEQLIV